MSVVLDRLLICMKVSMYEAVCEGEAEKYQKDDNRLYDNTWEFDEKIVYWIS